MMSMAVSTLPIDQAAQVLGFSPKLIEHLVAAGVIAGDKTNCNLDQAAQVVAHLRAVQEPLAGHPILATDAAVKYGFAPRTIYQWQQAGQIKLLESRSRGRLFDEGDIALAQALAELIEKIPGRSIFPSKPRSGRPRKAAA
ncbi:MAG: helix-turn-helix domain-containing protein [Chloroflexales bacterium]